ncbi:hypothetical protein T06_752 [Trichinella sp. T6]|nr:hypothetical protein T06_752 [Trichinella sp. T6]
MLSNVEIWLEHMKMHFWAVRVASERRAAFVQYHTDEEMQTVMWAMLVQVTDDYDGLLSALIEAFEILRQLMGAVVVVPQVFNGFENITAPLHGLLEKGAKLDWSKACSPPSSR